MKAKIKTKWVKKEDCFVSVNSEYPDIKAYGDTKEEAEEALLDHIEAFVKAKKAGN